MEERLRFIEEEVRRGNYALKKLGFWEIVEEAKKNREIALKYGKKIAEINRLVFEKKWKRKYNVQFGLIILFLISVFCIFSYPLTIGNKLYLSIYFPLASFILSATLHPITQYLVGRMLGIRFIYIYLRGIYIFSRNSKGKIHIEPALKLDYESYLNATPLKRAIMHVSGTFVTIAIVFFFFIESFYFELFDWSRIICGIIAISYLLTEIIYSPRYAAWKHFKEEIKIWNMLKSRKL